jgi:hypothetical protein
MLCITWKNKRSGWTRRARWYAESSRTEHELYTNIRICLEDETGMFNFIPTDKEDADKIWKGFKLGEFVPLEEWYKRGQ